MKKFIKTFTHFRLQVSNEFGLDVAAISLGQHTPVLPLPGPARLPLHRHFAGTTGSRWRRMRRATIALSALLFVVLLFPKNLSAQQYSSQELVQ